ncbi:methionine--tRNA ligase [Buchnera aphidicola (Astegopteryx bambusae)]|uniref:methionine--tRNA ligase n=1 Tax=Buchnera aphidicola TaxID=9 RepID=UPI0031B89A83
MKDKILVTCAFPYSNGPIHIGHLLEHIQADILVRYNRMKNNKIWFICADDAHGTAITLKARKNNVSEKFLIKNILKEHKQDFINFNISYDKYYSTHSKENLYLVKKIFYILKKNKLIKKKIIKQFYDNYKKIFLPDRYVFGSCPVCNSNKEYGDNCSSCGAFYSVNDLINPMSIFSKKTPILKETEHLFFNISYFKKILKKWIFSDVFSNNVYKKVLEWFNIGLKDWNISRDYPYFGFKIPGFKKKYFYVWFDASIGYISTFKKLSLEKSEINFSEFWDKNSNTKLYNFIGKDIIYFHSIFWPSILSAINFRKPTKIYVHGHVKLNDKKFSKSNNYIISAKKWLKHFDSDSLRYYYASKISNSIDDINISANDFINNVNSGLVNKIVNLASRNAKLINKYFDGMLSKKMNDSYIKEYNNFLNKFNKINYFFENVEYKNIIIEILKISDFANLYISKKAPWNFVNNNNLSYVQNVCSMGINFFIVIMTYIKPIIPDLSNKVEDFLNMSLTFENIKFPLLNHKISNVKILYKKILIKDFEKLLKK